MSWQRPHLYEGVTLAEHNRRVLQDLDHGAQSSLDDARAQRQRDYTPAQPPHPLLTAAGSRRTPPGDLIAGGPRDPHDLPQYWIDESIRGDGTWVVGDAMRGVIVRKGLTREDAERVCGELNASPDLPPAA